MRPGALLPILGGLFALAACGGGNTPPPKVKETKVEPPAEVPSTIVTTKDEPKADPYRAAGGPGDAPVPYVRDERSSRLDVPLPRGRAKETWRSPLALGDASPLKASFVIAAGNRAAVIGNDSWVVYDTLKGLRIAGHELQAPQVRIDRASGTIVPDDTRPADLPPDTKVAAHNGLVVMVKNGGVYVGERALEGKFEAFDVAIDDLSIAYVTVRQGDDLSLWTIPIAGNTSMGRHKIGAKRHSIGPPILGKSMRVLVLDTGIVAYGLDGKKLWERKGVPTGGASITSDDQVIVADANKILAIDRKGKTTELWSGANVVFATPPVINADGVLLAASRDSLHAIGFLALDPNGAMGVPRYNL